MHVRYVEQGDDLPEKRSCRDGTRSRSGDLEASVSVADISPSNDTFTSFTKIKKKESLDRNVEFFDSYSPMEDNLKGIRDSLSGLMMATNTNSHCEFGPRGAPAAATPYPA